MTLLPQHLADLQRSGLSDDTIRHHRLFSAPRDVATRLLDHDPGCTCLGFPYDYEGWSEQGTGLVRFRLDVPKFSTNGHPAKYLSPLGAENRLYIPQHTRTVLHDANVPLIMTEGEKKALKADQEGFPCLGLPGVSCWRQKPRDEQGCKIESVPGVPIPDLDAVAWRGRVVWICWDSDVSRKRDVMREQWALRCELVRRGAIVKRV